jgi:hypothetical protein
MAATRPAIGFAGHSVYDEAQRRANAQALIDD